MAASLLHGHLSPTHTSNLTAIYFPQNTPTPYPILVVSVLISLLISCYGVKGAFISLSKMQSAVGSQPSNRPQGVWKRLPRYLQSKAPITFVEPQSELESLHREDTSYSRAAPPRYQPSNAMDWELGDEEDDVSMREHVELRREPEIINTEENWMETSTLLRKILSIGVITYQTYRSVIGFLLALMILLHHSTTTSQNPHFIPAPSPSNILLLLVSVQVWACNLSFPRPIRLVLHIDILILLFAFLSISYSPLSNPHSPSPTTPLFPEYSILNITGGNCPVYASNCLGQMHHWSRVGCGNWTTLVDMHDSDNDDYETPQTKFYEPYAKHGDVNYSANPLYILEVVIYIIGTFQAIAAVFQVYETRYIIWPKPQARLDTRRGQCVYVLLGLIVMLGVMGAFVASIMSIAAHVSQETGTPGHTAMYLDSFGLVRNVNASLPGYEAQNGTSWTDCFSVPAPTGTHWRQWREGSGAWVVLRIAAGV